MCRWRQVLYPAVSSAADRRIIIHWCFPNVLQDYKGMKQLATLLPDGRISSNINGSTMIFESPSAFRHAIYMVLSAAGSCTYAHVHSCCV